MIVALARSTWVVTGTCYLTKLSLDSDSSVRAAHGHTLTMTVDPDGAAGEAPAVLTPIVPGQTYTGYIVLTLD